MLVLKRKPGEKIMIPSLGITICVVSNSAAGVRIGIDAPREAPIIREELLETWSTNTAESGVPQLVH